LRRISGNFRHSLYTGFFSGFQVTHMSRENVRATPNLVKKIETIRLCSWYQLSNFPATFQETFDARQSKMAPAISFITAP